MFTLYEAFARELDSSGFNPSFCIELRPRKELAYVDNVVMDINLESEFACNQLINSPQEETDYLNATRWIRGNSRPFCTALDAGYLKLGEGLQVNGASLAEAFSMEIEFKLSNVGAAEVPLFSICKTAVAADQRYLELGITDTNSNQFYVYILGTKYTSSSDPNFSVLSRWNVLGFSYARVAGDTTIKLTFNGVEIYSYTIVGSSSLGTTFGASFETLVGGYKNNTTYTGFQGSIGRVILIDSVSLSEASHLTNYEALAPPIVCYLSDTLLPNNVTSFGSIEGGINPILRNYETNQFIFTLADDGQLRHLNTLYLLPAIEVAVFLGFATLDVDYWKIIYSGVVESVKPEQAQLVVSCREYDLSLESTKQFQTVYLGHPGEIIRELFINHKFPRHLTNNDSLMFDFDVNFSHYFLTRQVSKNARENNIKAPGLGWVSNELMTGSWQHGPKRDPLSVKEFISNLETTCHFSLQKNQHRQFSIRFYDPTDASVLTLTDDDILEIVPAATYENVVNQFYIRFDGFIDVNTSAEEPSASAEILVVLEDEQRALALNQIFPSIKQGPDLESKFLNSQCMLIGLNNSAPGAPANPDAYNDVIVIASFEFSGLGLSADQRVIGGTRESDRTINSSRPLYIALWMIDHESDDPITSVYNQEAKFISAIAQIETVFAFPAAANYDPVWTSGFRTRTRRRLDTTGAPETITEYWPSPRLHFRFKEQGGILGTPAITDTQLENQYWATDVTPIVNAANYIIDRFKYGAPSVDIKLPLRFFTLEEGDIVKLVSSIGMRKFQDEYGTGSNFEVVSKKVNVDNVELKLVWRD